MRLIRTLFVVALLCRAGLAFSDEALPAQREFLPQDGKGPAVVLVSGHTGPNNYTELSADLAEAGFYVVLVDGNELWIKGGGGLALLKGIIKKTRESPHALPGKLGVVGCSLGGAAALTYAARLPDDVGAVVVQYPLTSFINDPADFVGKIKVPTLVLAGTFDSYKGCCMIEMARKLDAAAQSGAGAALWELHEYPGIDHGFSTNDGKRRDIRKDAIKRTVEHLRAHLSGS